MNETLQVFIDTIAKKGGRCLLIGGAVIDTIQSRIVKDWDIEIYGLSLVDILSTLKELGHSFKLEGVSFGVIITKIGGVDIDLSVPRRENKIGVGHKRFNIELDSMMTPKEAALRRDLTINSMYRDLHTGELIDPYNGLKDLHAGILRATNPDTFVEDPLRVLRIMQLLPRKGRVVEYDTKVLCSTIIDSFSELSKERVFEEFKKLLLKAERPSMGLEFLKECGWLVHFPELLDLIGCEQNPEWHPEGDVWVHTLMVLDNAAQLRRHVPEEYRLAYMFAALLHDIGKPSTTDKDLRSPKHDTAGIPLAKTFMERITDNKFLLELVPKLVGLHMRPGQLSSGNAKLSAWKRLHLLCRLDLLGWLSKADSAGRTGRSIRDKHLPSERCFQFHTSFPEKIKPLVKGRDLIQAGMTPSPKFTTILNTAFELQLEGWNKENILKRIL